MKKTFTLLCLLLAAFVTTRAQMVESEPNDSISQANFVPFDSTMTGNTCTYTQLDYFKFVTPANGVLQVITSVSATGNMPPPFSMDVLTTNGVVFQALSPARGVGVPKLDTLYFNCLAADTFIFLAHCNTSTASCYDYAFSFSVLEPTYGNGNIGNRSFNTAAWLDQNIATQGQLGYKRVPGNLIEASYYKIIVPVAGALQVYTTSDYTSSGDRVLNVGVFNKNMQIIDSTGNSIGTMGSPAMDTATFDCMAADTFYLRINQNSIYDCGWSYTVQYDVTPAYYAGDAEPNNTFAQATLINPGQIKTGQSHYGTDVSEDYYHFFKPDDGLFEIDAWATSSDSVTGIVKVRLYDNTQSLVESMDVPIGSYSVPQPGLMYLSALASDSFYVRVSWPNVSYCGSYNFIILTETVSGIQDKGLVPVSVMPNPSSGTFTFDLAGVHATALQVFDMNGRLVELVTGARMQSRLVTAGSSLQAGVYIARLYNGNEVSGVVRLVKTGM